MSCDIINKFLLLKQNCKLQFSDIPILLLLIAQEIYYFRRDFEK